MLSASIALLISIPFSTIKSNLLYPKDIVTLAFQFHLVRLKELLFSSYSSVLFTFQFHLVRLKDLTVIFFGTEETDFNSI